MGKRGLFLILLFVLVLLPIVNAQFGFLSEGYIDVGGFYKEYYQIIDFFLYFLLFGFLAQKVFAPKFGKSSTLISVVMGIGLSLGLVSWESSQGEPFYITLFGKYASKLIPKIHNMLLDDS